MLKQRHLVGCCLLSPTNSFLYGNHSKSCFDMFSIRSSLRNNKVRHVTKMVTCVAHCVINRDKNVELKCIQDVPSHLPIALLANYLKARGLEILSFYFIKRQKLLIRLEKCNLPCHFSPHSAQIRQLFNPTFIWMNIVLHNSTINYTKSR